MDYLKINDLVDAYTNEIKDKAIFKELLNLKETIVIKYQKEITLYEEAKIKLEEALKYGNYHPNLASYKENYQLRKIDLYSKEEVKKYFSLYRKLENLINSDFKEIKQILK